jgi:hypothetical protein
VTVNQLVHILPAPGRHVSANRSVPGPELVLDSSPVQIGQGDQLVEGRGRPQDILRWKHSLGSLKLLLCFLLDFLVRTAGGTE